MKYLLLIFFLFFVNACTKISVVPSDKIKSNLHSRITLTDNQQIRSEGFELTGGHLKISEAKESISIPSSDVHEIETIDRQKYLSKSLIGGATTGAIIALYEILTVAQPYAGWSIIAAPMVVISSGLVAGIGAYTIAGRTYYELNPLEPGRVTEYSLNLLDSKLAKKKSFNKRRKYHFGLNLGGGYSRLPAISKNIASVGQGLPENSFFANAEFGKWIDHKTIWGGNLFMLNANNSNSTNFATRGIFSFGPQITHFPSRYGFYYKASLNYGVYFESVEDINQLENSASGKIVHEKSFSTLGTSGSIGYAFTLNGRINLTAELSGRAHIISNNKTASMLAVTIGLHRY